MGLLKPVTTFLLPPLHPGLSLDPSAWSTSNSGDSGVPEVPGTRSPREAQGIPKLWKRKPIFSQTFIRTLDFHQVKHSSGAKKEICASSFRLRCVIHPFPRGSGGCIPAGQAAAGRDGKRKNQQGTHTSKSSKCYPTPTQGFSQVRVWNGCHKMLQIST